MIRRPPRSTLFPSPPLSRPPHPPLYLACTKDDTVTLAAEYGIGALVLGFSGPDDVAALHRRRSEEHTSELQSHLNLVCRLLLEKKKIKIDIVRSANIMSAT